MMHRMAEQIWTRGGYYFAILTGGEGLCVDRFGNVHPWTPAPGEHYGRQVTLASMTPHARDALQARANTAKPAPLAPTVA